MSERSTPESNFPHLRADDGTPYFLHGEGAGLEHLRAFQHKDVFISTTQNAGAPNDDEEEAEILIHHTRSSSVSVTLPSVSFTNVRSQVFVTTKRVFFVAHDEKDVQYDVSINAYCISLHALMTEPTRSIYCQLSDDVDNNAMVCEDEGETIFSKEVTIEPSGDDENCDLSCQELFNALSKLISLNPMDDDDEGSGSGGLSAMLGMMAGAYGGEVDYDDGDDEEDDDNMICRIDPSQMITAESIQQEGASSEERQKMLERLDNVLVVPPEFEVAGQFDDAEEELDSADDKIL